MLFLGPDGRSERHVLGQDILSGQELQVIVPKGVWQGSALLGKGRWALLGTTVAPAFDYDDYEQGDRQELIRQYPSQKDSIIRLTP